MIYTEQTIKDYLNIKILQLKQISFCNVYTSTQIITTSFLFKRNIIQTLAKR